MVDTRHEEEAPLSGEGWAWSTFVNSLEAWAVMEQGSVLCPAASTHGEAAG